MLEVGVMIGFGSGGYFFKKLEYPMAPLVLAIVLGDKEEASFRQSMLISQGHLSIVMTSSYLSAALTILAFIMLFWPLLAKGMELILPKHEKRVFGGPSGE
jgi:putative tricarboxylic transport membrane protein